MWGQSSRIWYGAVRWQITPYVNQASQYVPSTSAFLHSPLFTSCPQATAASGNSAKMACTPPELATFVFPSHSALHNKLYDGGREIILLHHIHVTI